MNEKKIRELAMEYGLKCDPKNQTLEKQADIRQGFIEGMNQALNLPVVSGLLCGSAEATKLVKGCTVYMDGASGCIGYGNIQCVSGVCEPLGEISLYGHNQNYSIDDIKEIASYPIVGNNR